MKLVSISGEANSGKSTFANIVNNSYSPVELVTFAGPLKKTLCDWFDWDLAKLTDDFDYKEGGLGTDFFCDALGMSRRKIMQILGTEVGRNLHPDLWVIIAEKRIQEIAKLKNPLFLLPDCRFINELDMVKRNGGTTILITSNRSTTTSDHKSEQEWRSWDFDLVIQNDSSLEDFTIKCLNMASRFYD